MSNDRTWKVIRWDKKPEGASLYELCCPHCGIAAMVEIGPTPGAQIIAAIGLGLIFEPAGYVPPPGFMPEVIRCRTCRRAWES